MAELVTGHTQGPWEAEVSSGSQQWVATSDGRDLALVVQIEPQTRAEMPATANARLMAAAPDLRRATEALCYLVRCMATGPGWTQELVDEILAAGDAAIKKADEGTQ